MKIVVLGSGCKRCKQTLNIVEKVVGERALNAEVEYITDIEQVLAYNVMATPAIVADGKVVFKGSVPSEAEVLKALGL